MDKRQELDRLKRADIVHKNFSSRLEQSVKEQDTARKKLFIARREYTDRFKPCSFRVEAMDNDEFESERRLLEESELPKYREKINACLLYTSTGRPFQRIQIHGIGNAKVLERAEQLPVDGYPGAYGRQEHPSILQ